MCNNNNGCCINIWWIIILALLFCNCGGFQGFGGGCDRGCC